MNERFYAAAMPFVGEVLIFSDEKKWDEWLSFTDDMSELRAEIGEPNDERRIPLTEDDINRLFMDCDPEIIECPGEEYEIMFSALVQRSAIISIRCRARLALNNVAPLTGRELQSVIPMMRMVGII